jgi:hypothetical protein
MMKKRFLTLSLLLIILLLLPACSSHQQPPELSISVSSPSLLYGSTVKVHVKITNPNQQDWKDYKALVGYAPENDANMIEIATLPLNLAGGETFEKDVEWMANLQPVEGVNYQVRMEIVKSDNTSVAEARTAIEFAKPTVSVSIDQTDLKAGSQAVIHVEVANPSGVQMHGYKVSLGYGLQSDTSAVLIQELPVDLKAGETSRQDIAWKVDYIPASGTYDISAVLLLPDSEQAATASTAVNLTAQ